jgi:hypothetical protein
MPFYRPRMTAFDRPNRSPLCGLAWRLQLPSGPDPPPRRGSRRELPKQASQSYTKTNAEQRIRGPQSPAEEKKKTLRCVAWMVMVVAPRVGGGLGCCSQAGQADLAQITAAPFITAFGALRLALARGRRKMLLLGNTTRRLQVVAPGKGFQSVGVGVGSGGPRGGRLSGFAVVNSIVLVQECVLPL